MSEVLYIKDLWTERLQVFLLVTLSEICDNKTVIGKLYLLSPVGIVNTCRIFLYKKTKVDKDGYVWFKTKDEESVNQFLVEVRSYEVGVEVFNGVETDETVKCV